MKRADIPLWRRWIITPDEAAVLTGLSSQTIREFCMKGKIPCFKKGDHIKIPVKKAEEAFAKLAEDREGFTERHRADDIKEIKTQRRRKVQ
ncbi:MAG: helix-turn-helix domain-containing protein [Firmicutes bacterium]|nr:helix-turn-helix domain-containing protein [Bacillota bacterium]